MANTVTANYKQVQPADIQDYLRTYLVSGAISTAKFGNIVPMQTIKFDYVNSAKVQNYGYQSGNARTDATFQADSYVIDQAKTAVMGYDKIQNHLLADPNWQDKMAQDMGYQLARGTDQYTIGLGVDNAWSSITGGTVDETNILQVLNTGNRRLNESQAMPGERYAVLDPGLASLIPMAALNTAFNEADNAFVVGMEGYVGKTVSGLRIYQSNSLEFSVALTLGTNPTANQTLSLLDGNIVFTFVANGTATNPGDISLGTGGSALADTQANIVLALTGTGTPGASTYIDLDSDTRIELLNTGLSCTNFSGNVATVSKFGTIQLETTATSAVVGTETSTALIGVKGAIDLTMSQAPMYETRPSNVAAGYFTHADDIGCTTLYGGDVWYRNKRALCAVTFNAVS